MFTTVSDDAKGMRTIRIGVFWCVTQSASMCWGSFEDLRIALRFPKITTLEWSPAHIILPESSCPMLIMELQRLAKFKGD